MSDREQPPRNPQRAPAARDPKAIEAARRFLSETLGQMGFTASVEVREEADETIFEIVGPDATHIVGKKGVTLDALQLLCNRVVTRALKGERNTVVVDADGYRARREESLTHMAQQLGNQCVKQGKVITMDPMPPRERRVVHMALARFAGVTTRSEGDGEERRIQIIPMPVPR